jgi:hypothetical protein
LEGPRALREWEFNRVWGLILLPYSLVAQPPRHTVCVPGSIVLS